MQTGTLYFMMVYPEDALFTYTFANIFIARVELYSTNSDIILKSMQSKSVPKFKGFSI